MASGSKSRASNRNQKSSFLPHAIIWIAAIAGGTVFAKLAYPEIIKKLDTNRVSFEDRVKAYETEAWPTALKNVRKYPPPEVSEFVKSAPIGQQSALQISCDQIYKDNLPKYLDAATKLYEEMDREFQREWDKRFREFDDTPTVEEYCKSAHEFHHEKVKARLGPVDARLKSKRTRTRLALDSFSGYCLLRSEEFRRRMTDRGHTLHLVDDGAVYDKRLKSLESGETQLAVFTVDALINNSAELKTPPAAIILVLDETRGADAVVTFKNVIDKPEDLNRHDLEVILTPNSPSEMMFRRIRTTFNVPKQLVPTNVETIEDVFKKFQEADPTSPKAFVLWEPYVTRIKDKPQAQVLIGSDHPNFQGYIVDVLVANKQYLKENPREVRDLVEAYLETQAEFKKDSSKLALLVQADAQRLVDRKILSQQLDPREAHNIVQGILWKDTQDNYGHFGLLAGDEAAKYQPLEKMIENITKVLVDTGAMTRDRADRQPANVLVDKDVITNLKATVAAKPVPFSVEPITFKPASSDINESLYGDSLRGLAEKLKAEPRWNVEVIANVSAKNNTLEDAELARQRAVEVARWLRQNGGLPETRIKVAVLKPPQGSGKDDVTFALQELPK